MQSDTFSSLNSMGSEIPTYRLKCKLQTSTSSSLDSMHTEILMQRLKMQHAIIHILQPKFRFKGLWCFNIKAEIQNVDLNIQAFSEHNISKLLVTIVFVWKQHFAVVLNSMSMIYFSFSYISMKLHCVYHNIDICW